ncbi:MAG: cell division ATPase MinD [Candidatus Nanoarchaeia archaeon]|nr:cell division ATPase MinD [Candidatus Nanoarchaeia archaeon]MDD5357975.1 cell division ATPase MinD [Candidatus Nanoarchaeia archaeon]MDD5588894.1 cell division ATPase MinD [Candidatus Nanoarchaeia archaeon]
MKKIIVITSGKGGVGKTTTAINLGAAINYFGKDVLVIDGNLTTPNVGIHLNSPEVPVNLNHVLSGKAEAYEAVYEHESGIKIMPSSLSLKELNKIKPEKIKDFRDDFKQISDYIIVDSAAGLGNEALSTINMADEIIIVTNPEMPAITDALKAIKVAEQMKKTILGIIVTRVKKNDIEMSPEVVKEMLESPILGMVPEDISIQESLSMKDAVIHTHPKSSSARAYKEIAARILEVEYDSNKDKPTIWEIIFRRRR